MSNLTCVRCKEVKPSSDFHLNRSCRRGFTYKCKKCSVEHAREYMATEAGKASRKRAYVKLRDRGYYKGLERTAGRRYSKVKRLAKACNRTFCITFDEYVSIVSQPCFYCGIPLDLKSGYGLDRVDNSKGYEKNNICACCAICNRIKSDQFTSYEMIQFIGPAIGDLKSWRTKSDLEQMKELV